MPQDVAALFDDDNDVGIASIKSHCNWHGSSSEASHPPTSESESVFDANNDNDDDEEFPVYVLTSRKSKQWKATQVSTTTILSLFYWLVSLSISVNVMLPRMTKTMMKNSQFMFRLPKQWKVTQVSTTTILSLFTD